MEDSNRNSDLQDLQNEIRKHKDEICYQARKMEALCNQHLKSVTEKNAWDAEDLLAKEEVGDLKRQNESQGKEIRELKKEAATQEDTIKRLRKEKQEQVTEMGELQEQVYQQIETIDSLRNGLVDLSNMVKGQMHRDEIERLEDKDRGKKEWISSNKKELEQHRTAYDKINDKLTELLTRLQEKESSFEILKKAEKDLINSGKNHASSTRVPVVAFQGLSSTPRAALGASSRGQGANLTLAGISRQLEKQKNEITKLRQEVEDQQKRLHEKDIEMAVMKSRIEQAEREREEIKRRLETEMAYRNKAFDFLQQIAEIGAKDAMQGISYNQEIVNKIRHIFVYYVAPLNVLNLFHQYDIKVLVELDIQQVECVTRQFGDMSGATILLRRLSKYENWYSCLLQVLDDPKVQMSHVAKKMEVLLGHSRGLVPLKEFDFSSLPQINDVSVELLQNSSDLVVRVDIIKTQLDLGVQQQGPQSPRSDPDDYKYGTGMVTEVYRKFKETGGSCPCHECEESQEPKKKWAEFGVQTSPRLMRYDAECRGTTCTLFYDTEDTDAPEKLVAVKLMDNRDNMGYCKLSCITHDKYVAEKLEQLVIKWKFSRLRAKRNRSVADGESEACVMISHTAGKSKCVSVGEVINMEASKITYNADAREPCCGAPVFLLGKGFFTGQTIHDRENERGVNESVSFVDRFEDFKIPFIY